MIKYENVVGDMHLTHEQAKKTRRLIHKSLVSVGKHCCRRKQYHFISGEASLPQSNPHWIENVGFGRRAPRASQGICGEAVMGTPMAVH